VIDQLIVSSVDPSRIRLRKSITYLSIIGSWTTLARREWRGRDGNDPSVDIAKDADQRF
jgi:hypothetical protein